MEVRQVWSKRSRGVVSLAILMLLLVVLTTTAFAQGGRPLSATLTGEAEVPGPGDPDGDGFAHLTLNQGQGVICFRITVDDLGTITGAHIHSGSSTEAGPVVVDFNPTVNGLDGCVSASKSLIKGIRQNPDEYYVNVHTTEYPAGAIRGQLYWSQGNGWDDDDSNGNGRGKAKGWDRGPGNDDNPGRG